jgi:hypothetical protein
MGIPPKEIKTMLSKKIWLVASAFTLAVFFGASAATAEDPQQCFTVSSIRGTYAVIGNYGAHEAIALGKRYTDGMGNLTGTFVVNEPTTGSTTGARTIVTGTQAGTYTVNCDGTGVITRVLTVGTTQTTAFDDFVITGAKIKNGELIATTIVDAQRTPSSIVAGGIFLTRVWTRLPQRSTE